MSDTIPERSAIIRSSVITTTLSTIVIVLALAFWAWSSEEIIDTSPVGAINAINPFITYVIEIVLIAGFFVFSTITVVNLRLYFTKIRSGWLEIIIMLAVAAVASYFMFGIGVMGATFVLCLGFVVYLYLNQ